MTTPLARFMAAGAASLGLALGAIECGAKTSCAAHLDSMPAPRAVTCAWDFVRSAGGATEERRISVALSTLRRHYAHASAIAAPLALRLQHQSQINHGRDKASILRLRAELMQTLTALGRPELTLAAVHDTLGYMDERSNATLVAVAARTAGALGVYHGKKLVPHLVELLALRIGDEAVLMEPERRTGVTAVVVQISRTGMSTGHLEALAAIEQICLERDIDLANAILSAPSVAGSGADHRARDLAQRIALRLGGMP